MSHYRLHLSEIPPRLSVSAELLTASTRKVEQHMFAKELEVISNYADEYGSTPRGSSNSEQQEDPTPAPPPDEGVSSEPAGSTTGQNRDGSNEKNIDVNNGVATASTVAIAADVAASTANTAAMSTTPSPPTDTVSTSTPGDDGSATNAEMRDTSKDEVQGVATGAGEESGVTQSVPANDPVTVVPGVEINPNSEQTVVHLDAAPVQTTEQTNVNVGVDAQAQVANVVGTAEEDVMSSSMKAAMAIAEQADKDEDMARLVDRDRKVSLLASKCNISRDECQFYLESTDWNVEEAVNIYNSFT